MTESQIEAVEGIEVGPVDYVVIEFADAKFTGEGLPILLDLVAKGIIRILDAVAIKANEDGSWVACPWRTSTPPGASGSSSPDGARTCSARTTSTRSEPS